MAKSSKFCLETEKYIDQKENEWPKEGRHILAQYDKDTIVVYQAFRTEIAEYADKNGKFGGPFYKFERMSWIKTNFMWMMYRSGWARKPNQERILAIRLSLEGFEEILRVSVDMDKSAYGPKGPQKGFGDGGVRLQWDPDHGPHGEKRNRRAIQLGLKGDILMKFNNNWILDISDITDFVEEQRAFVEKKDTESLVTPKERVFVPSNKALCRHIRLDVLVEERIDVFLKTDNTADKKPVQSDMVNVVLCLGGAFNPVHTRHVMAMVTAKRWLEQNTNLKVVAGRLAVSPNGYVLSKTRKSNENCIDATHRIRLCEIACENEKEWLSPYPKPCGSAMECGKRVKEDTRASGGSFDMKIVVIVGADRAVNKSGFAKWHKDSDHITLCIGRKGETQHVISKFEEDKILGKVENSNFFIVPEELDNVRSTDVRKVLAKLSNTTDPTEKEVIVKELVENGSISRAAAEYIIDNEEKIYIT